MKQIYFAMENEQKTICWQLFKPFTPKKYEGVGETRQISVQILALLLLFH